MLPLALNESLCPLHSEQRAGQTRQQHNNRSDSPQDNPQGESGLFRRASEKQLRVLPTMRTRCRRSHYLSWEFDVPAAMLASAFEVFLSSHFLPFTAQFMETWHSISTSGVILIQL